MKKKNFDLVQINEHKFQIAYTTWEISNYTDINSYQRMFTSMFSAAKNMIKAEAKKKNIYVDVDGKALDLTCLIFERDIVSQHKRPKKLSSYLYLPMVGVMYGHQLQFEDKCNSYESVVENHDIQDVKLDIDTIDILKKENLVDTGSEIVSEEQVKIVDNVVQYPDYIMKLLGWEYHE